MIRKKILQLQPRRVLKRDRDGFEDLDDFWSDDALAVKDKSSANFRSIPASERDEDDDFNYDTSDSISITDETDTSDAEEEEEEDEVEGELTDEEDQNLHSSPLRQKPSYYGAESSVKSPIEKSVVRSFANGDGDKSEDDDEMVDSSSLRFEDSVELEQAEQENGDSGSVDPTFDDSLQIKRGSRSWDRSRSSYSFEKDSTPKSQSSPATNGSELNSSRVEKGKMSAPMPLVADNKSTIELEDAVNKSTIELEDPSSPNRDDGNDYEDANDQSVYASAEPSSRRVSFENLASPFEGSSLSTSSKKGGLNINLSPILPSRPSTTEKRKQSSSTKSKESRNLSVDKHGSSQRDNEYEEILTSPEAPSLDGRSVRKSFSSSSRFRRMSHVSTPGSEDFARGHKLVDDSYRDDVDDENENESDDSGLNDDSGFTDTSFMSAVRRRVEENKGEELEDERDEEAEDDQGNARRSKRLTKGKRLAFWKNERPVYDKGEMIGFLTAQATPAKHGAMKSNRRRDERRPTRGNRHADKRRAIEEEDGSRRSPGQGKGKRLEGRSSEEPVFDLSYLPSDVQFINRSDAEELSVWDDPNDTSRSLKVVCLKETLAPHITALPITTERPSGRDGVGFAAQSFNVAEIPGVMSGWISGFVELPPRAIKDAEGVGECSQVFFVGDCQDDSLELGLADPREEEWVDALAQRLVLKKGDSFFVPPGNIYRLENHSSIKSAMIYWTIVKPMEADASEPEVL